MRRRQRRVIGVTVVASLILGIGAGSASAGTADSSGERTLFDRINQERRAEGLQALTWDSAVAKVARDHAADMASSGRLEHNRRVGDQVQGWSSIGENVGTAYGVGAVHAAFMRSEPHRKNILGRFTRAGVGVVVDDEERVWVTEVFMTPASRRAPAEAPKKRKPVPERTATPPRQRPAVPVARPVARPAAAPKPRPAPSPLPDPVARTSPAPSPAVSEETIALLGDLADALANFSALFEARRAPTLPGGWNAVL